MKVTIPPAIRRIMQAYPPVEPLTAEPPLPPAPPPTIDFGSIVVQIVGVFCLAWIVLKTAQYFYRSSPQVGDILKNMAVIGLVLGLVIVTVRALLILRQQIRPDQKKENEYLLALATYAQVEKKYYDRLAQEHAPEKVRAYRQQELLSLRQKLPPFDFQISAKTDPLPAPIGQLQEQGHLFYQPLIPIPAINESYKPLCIWQNHEKSLTIVIDMENNQLDQDLIKEFFSQRGVIWILATESELESPALVAEIETLIEPYLV